MSVNESSPMRKLQCELCGGIEIRKNPEGFFECLSCGCQYTLEQAKALIGTVIINNYATPEKSDFVIEGGVLKKYTGNDERVVIPNGVVEIADWCFHRNLTMKEVIIPNTVRFIGQYAFRDTAISNIDFPNSLRRIGEKAFSNTLLKQVVLPSSVEEAISAFDECKKLSKIDASASNCERFLVNDCPNLVTLKLPQVRIIPYHSFEGCKSLKSIDIPKTVQEIGDDAFKDLEYVIIPDSIPADNISPRLGCKFTYKGVSYPSDYFYEYGGSSIKEALQYRYVREGRCRYCGGSFKGVFIQTCSSCGRKIDY